MKISKVPNTIKKPITYPCLMECEEGCVYLVSKNPHSHKERAILLYKPSYSNNPSEVGEAYSSIDIARYSLLETSLLIENT